MERDFLGAIGMAGKAGGAVKHDSRTETDNPPATQWQFPAKPGAAPAFMSFRTGARDEGSNEFSISGFRPAAAAGDAFDGIKKQASLPVTPQQRQFGLNSHVTAQQYPAAAHGQRVQGMDYGTAAAHHSLPGGSRMVQPLSVRHPAPFSQANPMMLRSQSFHSGAGMQFKNQQPFTMSNGFGVELGLGPCRADTARPSRASCRIVLSFLGTLGTSCRAAWHDKFFTRPKHGPWHGGTSSCRAGPSTALTI